MSKFQTILKQGIEPYKEGKRNFNLNIPDIEILAEHRYDTACKTCELFIEEKNPLFKKGGVFGVKEDERIIELENKICSDCGCTSTYKLRQSISVCKKWQH